MQNVEMNIQSPFFLGCVSTDKETFFGLLGQYWSQKWIDFAKSEQ